MENNNKINLLENDSLLTAWQKSELDKSLTEIENGKVQSEDWEFLESDCLSNIK